MTAPPPPSTTRPQSPTLSEIEHDLEAHLCTIERSSIYSQETTAVDATESQPACRESLTPGQAVHTSIQPSERRPSLPRRSRKREWIKTPIDHSRSSLRRRSEPDLTSASSPQAEITIGLKRSPSVSSVPLLWSASSYADCVCSFDDAPISAMPSVSYDDGLIVVCDPTTLNCQSLATVSPISAGHVLLGILSRLHSIDDLCNTAMINKGMFSVYQENELQLLRKVLHNQSPAAWELRQWTLPTRVGAGDDGCLQDVSAAKIYLHSYRQDLRVIRALQQCTLRRCRLLVRPQTAYILSAGIEADLQRFDDAFWRIWSFCAIFGSGKDREDDVTGQLDWLRGGILAHSDELTATTMNVNLDFEMISVLLNTPEYFAGGNSKEGLTAGQLYDMVEIWDCLRTLLQGYHGRTGEAGWYGVFDGLDISGQNAEEELLEEWTAHLMTLGPAVILEMAALADDAAPSGFALAKAKGWTDWSPREGGSRATFLKEPVSRLYEERISAASAKLQVPGNQEVKEKSRKRVANLAAEIKLARKASCYKRLPVIDMSTEQPMSAVSRCNSMTSAMPASAASHPTVSRRSTVDITHRPSFSSMSSKASRAVAGRTQPIIEETSEPLDFASLATFGDGIAEDTSVRALKRIVAMGFPAAAARDALRMTDTGNGLRVDRAVDLLLGRQ